MVSYENALYDSGKEKLSFNWKKPLAKPGLGWGSHLSQLEGGEGKKTGQRQRARD